MLIFQGANYRKKTSFQNAGFSQLIQVLHPVSVRPLRWWLIAQWLSWPSFATHRPWIISWIANSHWSLVLWRINNDRPWFLDIFFRVGKDAYIYIYVLSYKCSKSWDGPWLWGFCNLVIIIWMCVFCFKHEHGDDKKSLQYIKNTLCLGIKPKMIKQRMMIVLIITTNANLLNISQKQQNKYDSDWWQ